MKGTLKGFRAEQGKNIIDWENEFVEPIEEGELLVGEVYKTTWGSFVEITGIAEDFTRSIDNGTTYYNFKVIAQGSSAYVPDYICFSSIAYHIYNKEDL